MDIEQICQNCKNSFTIDQLDQDFYKKLEIPCPTFCPLCRLQARMMFRNERNLYRRVCDLCKENIVSTFAPEKPYIIYCGKCWWSDNWDPLDYGVEYDSNKTFFEQLKELSLKVPQMARVIDYGTVINSEYINHAGSCKNCTFLFNADFCENVLYGTAVVHSQDSLDLYGVDTMSLCYEITDGGQCSKCFFSKSLTSCVDVYFSRDLTGCMNCFGCVNLRNKSYYVFNKPVSKEEFKKVVENYKLDTCEGIKRARKDTENFFLKYPRRYVYGQKNFNSNGNYVYNSKNAKNCWSGQYYEDCAYCQFSTLPSTKDCYDLTEWGNNAERVVNSVTVGENAQNIKYCSNVWADVFNIEYSILCTGGLSNIFGCISLKKKEYCILNKQYTKEEFTNLRKKIVDEMNKNPYIDEKGRIWKYGDFFPYNLSFFDYNESWAKQHFPLEREQALENAFKWRDIPKNIHEPTIKGKEFTQSILNLNKSVLNEIIQCSYCSTSFKILEQEFELLKRFSIALPQECPHCRADKRLTKIGNPILYKRLCDNCNIEMYSSFPENAPEIVYCEKCYQEEVS